MRSVVGILGLQVGEDVNNKGHGIGILHESVNETIEALTRQVHPAK
jgi:hypothetical protein